MKLISSFLVGVSIPKNPAVARHVMFEMFICFQSISFNFERNFKKHDNALLINGISDFPEWSPIGQQQERLN